MDLNRLILVGRLVRDPETRYAQSGDAVTSFSIAVNQYAKGGEKRASFHDCTAFGKQADFVAKWFTKGKEILIEGRLDQDKWKDKETGKERSKTLIKVDRAGFTSEPKREEEPPARKESAAYDPDEELAF